MILVHIRKTMLRKKEFWLILREAQKNLFLENGTIITPLLLFYLDLGLVCKKIYRLMQYFLMKCSNNIVQCAVSARREGEEKQNSNVVTERKKLPANNSDAYRLMNRGQHTVAKYLSDENTHGAIIKRTLKRLGYLNDQLYEVELVKSETEFKEPNIVGFSILQSAKLKLPELCYNFFDKYCEVTKLEKLEMDTN